MSIGIATLPSWTGTSRWVSLTASLLTLTERQDCSNLFFTPNCLLFCWWHYHASAQKESKRKRSPGRESGWYLPLVLSCSFSTGGYLIYLFPLCSVQHSTSPLFPQAISVCWWVAFGWAACYKTTSWMMFSITRTNHLCRKHVWWRMSIPSICLHASTIKRSGTMAG